MTTISKKMTYTRYNAWRGHERPVNAICGANDTGSWSDSPCPSNMRKEEINKAKRALRTAGIKHLTMWAKTSNVFCMVQYVLVAPDDRNKAKQILEPLVDETNLLYICNH